MARSATVRIHVGSEGYLTPNENYDTAVVIIDELDEGTSKRELARRADITRKTVSAINENRGRYTESFAESAVET